MAPPAVRPGDGALPELPARARGASSTICRGRACTAAGSGTGRDGDALGAVEWVAGEWCGTAWAVRGAPAQQRGARQRDSSGRVRMSAVLG